VDSCARLLMLRSRRDSAVLIVPQSLGPANSAPQPTKTSCWTGLRLPRAMAVDNRDPMVYNALVLVRQGQVVVMPGPDSWFDSHVRRIRWARSSGRIR
jgi:hypothetical protein